jgi:hypothetical protein
VNCISDVVAQQFIREHDHPLRWWVEWDELLSELLSQTKALEISDEVASKWAYLIAGYRMVSAQDPMDGREWKRLRRSATLRACGISADRMVSSKSTQGEHLHLAMIRIMIEDLAKHGYKRAQIPECFNKVVQLLGKKLSDASIERQERRSRNRTIKIN